MLGLCTCLLALHECSGQQADGQFRCRRQDCKPQQQKLPPALLGSIQLVQEPAPAYNTYKLSNQSP